MDDSGFRTMREAMVSNQLRTTAVNDPRVIDAMRSVPRERHVPSALAPLAYTDSALKVNGTRAITSPMVVGRLLTEARVQRHDRALVVAVGGGYSAAVLGRIAGSVVALEEDETLIAIARTAADGYSVEQGPIAAGWPAGAPYDVILIDGAVEELPDALIAQLADGGRLVTGLVENGVMRLAIGRKAGASFGLIRFAEAEVPMLPSFARPPAFAF